MKQNNVYEKVVTWKKKPEWQNLIWESAMISIFLFMLCCLVIENKRITILTAIFTLSTSYLLKKYFSKFGKGRKVYYKKSK